jgi:type II secretory pathway component PulK
MYFMSHRCRGAVLILVIAAVALLAVLAVELASRASVQSLQTGRASRDAAFRRLFDSAMQVAIGLIAESAPKPYDFWGDSWNREVRLTLGQDEQVVSRLADESGKISLNGGQGPEDTGAHGDTIARLFEHLGMKRTSENVIPWADVKLRVFQRLGFARAEDKWVRSFQTPPLVTLDGLREGGLAIDEVFGEAGLARYLTCFGDGKININTAPPAVLYALEKDFDEAVVERIARHRGGFYGEPGEYTPFKDPQELKAIEGVIVKEVVDGRPRVVRDLYEQVRDRITVKSSCFSVRMEATVSGRTRQAWAFFETAPASTQDPAIKQTVLRLAFEVIEP